MNTYSDVLNPIRVFLGDRKPTRQELITREDGSQIERWLIEGREIILRIEPSGEWHVFVPVSTHKNSPSQIADLERFLLGFRPDLDTLADMANICDRFLSKLADLPACTDAKCTQAACLENQRLRTTITDFKSRLYTPPKKEKSHVSA